MREREIFAQNPTAETFGGKLRHLGKEGIKWQDRVDWGVLVAGGVVVGVGVIVPLLSGLALAAGLDIGQNYFVKDRLLAGKKKETLPVG